MPVTFRPSVLERARFVHDAHGKEFLEALYETSATRHRTIPAGKIVWRTQLGHATEERIQDDDAWDEPVPYAADRMKPIQERATGLLRVCLMANLSSQLSRWR